MRRAKLPKHLTALTAVFAGATAALAPGAAAQAVTIKKTKGTKEMSLQAGDDSYTSSSRATAGFGADDKLVAGPSGKDVKTSYVKFTIPAGTDVTDAKLFLHPLGKPTGTITIARVLDNSWTETKLTAATAPKTGLAIASVTPGAGDTRIGFDLAAEVYGAGTYSFAVTGTSTVKFQSSENAAKGGPELTFTTTAEVAAPVTGAGSGKAPKAGTNCVTDAKLIPNCNILWGGAAGGFTATPRDIALKDWEKASGRTASIFHQYHKGDEAFPTKAEIAMTQDPAKPRVLLENWKIAYGSNWAKVAKGEQDARIDAFAKRAKAYGKKFFLVLNHEPENDVIAKAGSGWEAKDFAAMYRHTILRLRAQGVTNVVNVMAYMGNEKWMAQSWWKDLYPGNDVVDWVGLDSYVSVEKGYYHFGDFGDILDRGPKGGPGFYDWAVAKAPGKPFMLAEWGGYHRVGKNTDKSAVYNDVLSELAKRPAIKAIVHFDTKHDDQGDRDISIDSTPASLAAFKKLAANPVFNVKIG
ncbi:hypothetical protein ACTI_72700 [Actinoplanes sp. OR16]|uniref:CBM96 family carbohydrate-binding protein n=1 Tax=Actinoplanes sp. OR16 TaxID=946334 RepID=UPI000F6B9998|nr:DNRLRE domain-containing protein [Actinoplanes sp. OR16]BBH70585.1 hypothetical protein ACTI_72700 [Actinoplanes sp. OR16]